MLVSSAEEKTGECIVCCHKCGAFLMESVITTSYMVCPKCGSRLVGYVKKARYPFLTMQDLRKRLQEKTCSINQICRQD